MTFSRIIYNKNSFLIFSKYTSKRFISKIYIQNYASLIEFNFILTFAFKFNLQKPHILNFFFLI